MLAECQALALQKIDWLLAMENEAPFTANEPYLADYRKKFLRSYREARPEYRYVFEEIREEMPTLQEHKYEPALNHMASARAYFRGSHWFLSSTSYGLLIIPPVAFKRFTDMIPMAIDQELLRGLDWGRGLYPALTKGLEITGPGSLDKAKEYLQEPPEVKNRRESLQKKRERLQSAKRELQSI